MPTTVIVNDNNVIEYLLLEFGKGDICVGSGKRKKSGLPVIVFSSMSEGIAIGDDITEQDNSAVKVIEMEFKNIESITVVLNALLLAQKTLLKLKI